MPDDPSELARLAQLTSNERGYGWHVEVLTERGNQGSDAAYLAICKREVHNLAAMHLRDVPLANTGRPPRHAAGDYLNAHRYTVDGPSVDANRSDRIGVLVHNTFVYREVDRQPTSPQRVHDRFRWVFGASVVQDDLAKRLTPTPAPNHRRLPPQPESTPIVDCEIDGDLSTPED